jgi:hypothetical protein
MGRSKRETLAIDQRRQAVMDWYLQCYTQVQIAQQLGIAQSTVSSDLKMIQKQWRESAIRDFDLYRAIQLAKIDKLEREANAAWERSQKPLQEARVEGEPPDQRTSKRIKNQYGDARFLDVIHKCIGTRCALLGLNAPTKIAPTTPDGEPLSFEQRELHIEAVLEMLFGPEETDNHEEKPATRNGAPNGS